MEASMNHAAKDRSHKSGSSYNPLPPVFNLFLRLLGQGPPVDILDSLFALPTMGLTGAQLQNIQGDIWSQGFPKYHETYYFFTIKPDNEKIFAGCLKKLVEDPTPLISNLQKVKEDQKRIKSQTDQPGPVAGNSGAQGIGKPLLPVKNALIAFTSKGLNAVRI